MSRFDREKPLYLFIACKYPSTIDRIHSTMYNISPSNKYPSRTLYMPPPRPLRQIRRPSQPIRIRLDIKATLLRRLNHKVGTLLPTARIRRPRQVVGIQGPMMRRTVAVGGADALETKEKTATKASWRAPSQRLLVTSLTTDTFATQVPANLPITISSCTTVREWAWLPVD